MKFQARILELGYGPLFLILIGCLARFYRLDFQPLWIDELIDWSIVNLPTIGLLLEKSSWTAQVPTGYVFYRYFFMLFTDSVWALRFIPALLSCLSLVYLAFLVKKFFNHKTLLITLSLTCINPTFLWHAQEFRPYSALLCFSVMSSFHLLSWLETKSPSQYWAFLFSSIFMTQSHHFGLLFVLLQPLGLLLYNDKIIKPLFVRYFLSILILFILQIPWMSELIYYLLSDNADLFYAQISSSFIHAVWDYWSLIYKPQMSLFSFILFFIAVLGVLNFILIQLKARRWAMTDKFILVLIAWSIIPFFLFYTSQSLMKDGGYPNRYLMFCAPYLIIIISYTLQKAFSYNYASLILCVCILGFQAPTLVGDQSMYRTYNRIDFPKLIHSLDIDSLQSVYVLGAPHTGLKYYITESNKHKVKEVTTPEDLKVLHQQIEHESSQAIGLIFISNSLDHAQWIGELKHNKNFKATYEDENYQVISLRN